MRELGRCLYGSRYGSTVSFSGLRPLLAQFYGLNCVLLSLTEPSKPTLLASCRRPNKPNMVMLVSTIQTAPCECDRRHFL